jgi:hypothetical protein
MTDNYLTLIEYCKHELDIFRKRLKKLKSGDIKFGNSSDGRTWTDTTDEDIAFAESKIAELERLLAEH